ncbi:Prohibitin-2, subunit of the prohibitin complex (Phb1p-Phb2p) [Homalodisca vitripennis]|nr:Prohibitin-2, subunit of the prohibitin complex (Phb1p-Phb2p) [Homalodisca vitripennis]
MAQSKFTDMANRLGNNPKGLGTGLKILAAAGAAVYGISQSMFTVEGGHRAIIFSRLGGIQNDIYTEGLHFRIPWFQYPIIYDIRTVQKCAWQSTPYQRNGTTIVLNYHQKKKKKNSSKKKTSYDLAKFQESS